MRQVETDWSSHLRSIRRLTDGRGMPIDEGILETVAILRLLGVNTVGSCEGHLDRGYGPYVSFEAKAADSDRELQSQIRQKFKGKTGEIDYTWRAVITKMSQDEIAERRKLLPYLDEFYANRNTLHTARLTLESLGLGSIILRCQNAILVGSPSREPLAARRRVLEMNQREMQDFTEFLQAKAWS
jgi:hypothetical protein